jgi:phosphatidylglycerol---prolipoprotein diacylglyceryl transferase
VIPYFPQPVWHLGPLQIHAFGFLVAVAVVVAVGIVLIRAQRQGIPAEQMLQFCFWVYTAGIAGAFLAKLLWDIFPAVLLNPSLIVHHTLGLRSVGGISGGLVSAFAWCRYHKFSALDAMRRLDIAAYAVPTGWMIGRLGCALAHDHRGLASTSWIAVQFPEGPRYDLGLIEFLFLIVMVIGFKLLDRKPRPVGFFFGLYGVVYGGFRVWLDTLHIQPNRFYGGIAGIVVGLAGWAVMLALDRSQSHARVSQPTAEIAS